MTDKVANPFKIYIRGLPKGTQETAVRGLLEKFGSIKSIRFHGVAAFVEFGSKLSANNALLEMNGFTIGDSTLSVCLAFEKQQSMSDSKNEARLPAGRGLGEKIRACREQRHSSDESTTSTLCPIQPNKDTSFVNKPQPVLSTRKKTTPEAKIPKISEHFKDSISYFKLSDSYTTVIRKFNSFDDFVLLSENYEKTMKDLQQVLMAESMKSVQVNLIKPGLVCLCLHDAKYCRCYIISSQSDATASVLMLDTLEEMCVPINTLKLATRESLGIPAQAVRGKIANIKPVANDSKYDEETIEAMKIALDDEVKVTLVNQVDAVAEVDLLVNDVQMSTALVEVQSAERIDPVKRIPYATFPSVGMASKRTVDLFSLHIESPTKIFGLQYDSDAVEAVFSLVPHEHVANQNPHYVPMINEVCLAYDIDDLQWYRAHVFEQVDYSHFLIQYIDYGNTKTINCAKLKPLPPDFLKFPRQAIHMAIEDIPNTPQVLSTLCTLLLTENETSIKFKATPYRRLKTHLVEQFFVRIELETGKDLVALLNNKLGLNSTSSPQSPVLQPSSSNHKEITSVISTPMQSTVKDNKFSFRLPTVGEIVSVKIVGIISPLEFYVSFNSELFDEYIHKTATNSNIIIPKVDQICFMFLDKSEWVRVKVKQLNDDVINVSLIDRGIIMTLGAPIEFRKMDPFTVSIPSQAIKCSLYSVRCKYSNQYCNQEATKAFQQMNIKANNTVKITVKAIAEGAVKVDVESEDYKSFTQKLIDLGFVVQICPRSSIIKYHQIPPRIPIPINSKMNTLLSINRKKQLCSIPVSEELSKSMSSLLSQLVVDDTLTLDFEVNDVIVYKEDDVPVLNNSANRGVITDIGEETCCILDLDSGSIVDARKSLIFPISQENICFPPHFYNTILTGVPKELIDSKKLNGVKYMQVDAIINSDTLSVTLFDNAMSKKSLNEQFLRSKTADKNQPSDRSEVAPQISEKSPLVNNPKKQPVVNGMPEKEFSNENERSCRNSDINDRLQQLEASLDTIQVQMQQMRLAIKDIRSFTCN